jgi:hypothetical protein
MAYFARLLTSTRFKRDFSIHGANFSIMLLTSVSQKIVVEVSRMRVSGGRDSLELRIS